MKYRYFMFVFIILVTSLAFSSDITEIHWGTEIWKGFTDKDGSGLYTQVMMKIFEPEGIEVNIQIFPIKRALYLAKVGQLDISGGIPRDIEKSDDYIQARYPIVVSHFNAFYHQDTIKEFEGIESIRNKRIVCTPTVGEMIGLNHGEFHVVPTREQAIKLVIINRFDVYIDDEKVLQTTLDEYQDEFDRNDYVTQFIATKGWYMITTNSERGRKIMDIYENGMLKLAKSGELETLYKNLGFIVPEISD